MRVVAVPWGCLVAMVTAVTVVSCGYLHGEEPHDIASCKAECQVPKNEMAHWIGAMKYEGFAIKNADLKNREAS